MMPISGVRACTSVSLVARIGRLGAALDGLALMWRLLP
jgi:hypothetical protein